MPEITKTILIILGACLAIPLIQFVALVVQILRIRIWPTRMLLLDKMPDLPPDQRAAIEELVALGFQKIACAEVENGPRHHVKLLFRHTSFPAFSSVIFQAGMCAYPISFYSFSADGAVLVTVNRLSWGQIYGPSEQCLDAYADDLMEHWQTHMGRLITASALELADDEAITRLVALSDNFFGLLQEQEAITLQDESWHFRVPTALRLAVNYIRIRRKLARPYQSVVTSPIHQSAFFAFCYNETMQGQLNRPPRRKLKFSILLVSLVLSALLWAQQFTWGQALALVVILLVHESGHALLMRAFGYRDMSMFFVPFVGAVVTGVASELPAWKQALVLLAGPVPGLLVGLGILSLLQNSQTKLE